MTKGLAPLLSAYETDELRILLHVTTCPQKVRKFLPPTAGSPTITLLRLRPSCLVKAQLKEKK